MANAQKRGFRFPWGGDERHDDDVETETRGDGVGSEPFEGQGDAPDTSEAAATAAASPADGTESESAGQVGEGSEATMQVDEAAAHDGAAGGATASWPEVDRRGPARPLMQPTAQPAAGPGTETPATGAGVAGGRRANPLVAGLVKAMREAARGAREEAVTSLRAEAVAHGEAIRAAATGTAADLRKTADADMAGIREWSKAELARVREETEQRLADRRTQLVSDTEAQAAATEGRLAQLEEAVRAFEAEMESFFDTLLAEEDPARLAGLAERMPAPPPLSEFETAPVDGSATRTRTKAETEPEPEPQPELEASTEAAEAGEPTRDDADGVVVEPGQVEGAGAAESEPSPPAEPADHLDAAAAAEAEAAALAGLDQRTLVVASGLAGVAGIARFKGELMRIAGVRAVSVTAGTDGEFQFAVTHDAEADLRAGLGAMSAFETRVVADDGATVFVVTHEAAA